MSMRSISFISRSLTAERVTQTVGYACSVFIVMATTTTTTTSVHHYLKSETKSRVYITGSGDMDWNSLYYCNLPIFIALYVKQNNTFISFPPEIKFETAFIMVNDCKYYDYAMPHYDEGRYMLTFKLCPNDCNVCATGVHQQHCPVVGEINLKIDVDEGLKTDLTLYSVATFKKVFQTG